MTQLQNEQMKIVSPIGPLFLTASQKGLTGVHWESQGLSSAAGPLTPQKTFLHQAQRQLEEYFSGARTEFDIPLDMQGTDFQKRVWQQLREIPYGRTVTYSDVANGIENAKAARAVGSANGENPLCIVVPCHRVVPKSGGLGGYSGRPGAKEKLLALEASVM